MRNYKPTRQPFQGNSISYARWNNNEIKLTSKRVHWGAYESLQKAIYNVVDVAGHPEINIDISRATRGYLDGVVPLIALISAYRARGTVITVKPPRDTQAKSFFNHLGWLHFLEPSKYKLPRDYGNNSLVLFKFSSDEELNEVVNRVIEVCMQQLVFAEGALQAFEWAINEISGNVLVHSDSDHGWIQVIKDSNNQQLNIVVCDGGIGIPASMRRAYKLSTDLDAINEAMKKGVTSNPTKGQGNGLAGTLSIAQHNDGMLSIVSGKGRVIVHNGRVQPTAHFPPFSGTIVSMEFATDKGIDLPRALWGHTPTSYTELHFEDEKGGITFKLSDYAPRFGNRITGERIHKLVINLIRQNPGVPITIDMTGISIIASSFADELFGKIAAEFGVIDFSRLIRLSNLDATCKSIIDVAIAQRLAQTVGHVTPVPQEMLDSIDKTSYETTNSSVDESEISDF